jgi:bisphosphoglycerate-independent phosphoglycerate mutase (AlkP superfamily)
MTATFGRGVRIAGTGRAVPAQVLTNKDLEKLVDTSDEWIVQRTGIRARHKANDHETVFSLGRDALLQALQASGVNPADLDMVIVATVSGEMLCPSTAARISEAVGADDAAVARSRIRPGDAVLFFNFRGARPRELTKAFVLDDAAWKSVEKGGFDRGARIDRLFFATLAEYERP